MESWHVLRVNGEAPADLIALHDSGGTDSTIHTRLDIAVHCPFSSHFDVPSLYLQEIGVLSGLPGYISRRIKILRR